MINILYDYIHNSLPDWGDFTTNPGLNRKVDWDGTLLPFIGNTVVFLLDGGTKEALGRLQQELYAAAPEMLAQPLSPDTFHATLHDLWNGTPDSPDGEAAMAAAAEKAMPILKLCREISPIAMRATWTFNMVNTSIVLGLEPADEVSWRRLDAMYCAMDTVCPLGYALTPHITLAYYRPGIYDVQIVSRLKKALRLVELETVLNPQNLVLQNFCSMNHYETVSTNALLFYSKG